MTKIAFTGDVAFSKHFQNTLGPDLLSDEVVNFLTEADHVVVNVEGSMTVPNFQGGKSLYHVNNPEGVHWIKKIGGDIWNLANNHIMDCGLQGYLDTKALAVEHGCVTVGCGENIHEAERPLILEESGGIGILSLMHTEKQRADEDRPGNVMWDDYERIGRNIKAMKEKNRWCVIVVHGDQEFSYLPMPYARKKYKKYLELGADIVVAHHPHVVQNYETFGDKIIFYSLGNFIFDTDYQRVQKYTEDGVLVKINFAEDSFSWEYLPVKINRETQTIGKGQCPAVFCDINESEYRRLWPVTARNFCRNLRNKKAFLDPAKKDWPLWKWWHFELEECKKEYGKDVIRGRLAWYLQLWRLSEKKEIIDYMR